MINFSLRQLQYFVATVEHGGVSAAARACHVSQPSVSLAIAQLETALGSTLFRRQASRGVELTAAGQRVLAQARDILGQAVMAWTVNQLQEMHRLRQWGRCMLCSRPDRFEPAWAA